MNFEEGTRFDPGKLSKVVVHGWGGGLHLGMKIESQSQLCHMSTYGYLLEYLSSEYLGGELSHFPKFVNIVNFVNRRVPELCLHGGWAGLQRLGGGLEGNGGPC